MAMLVLGRVNPLYMFQIDQLTEVVTKYLGSVAGVVGSVHCSQVTWAK